MKRLSELPANDRLTARAHLLIRATGPTAESEERLQRVRRSLDAPARAVSPRWVWRGALALGLIGVSAAAAAGSSTLSRVFGGGKIAEESGRQAPPDRASASRAVPTTLAPASDSVFAPAVPSASELALAPTSTPARAPAPHGAVPPLSDVARVHEAAKALRHDADPERALQLLERGAPVTGPLAEEALALRIEASTAHGDGRQAKLAAAYLAQYPNGRYRELAKKALSGTKP
jgi:hypothetical protein